MRKAFAGQYSLARILRLGFGGALLVWGAINIQWPETVIGAVLFAQGVWNLGCGIVPGSSCEVPDRHQSTK